jgi:hypothetical protein
MTNPKHPLASYQGRMLGDYRWFAFHAKSGLHYLRRVEFPQKWIRLTDAQWDRPDVLFGLEHHWFFVDSGLATRLVNPHVPRSPKRKRQRKGQFTIVPFSKITKP